jgi:glucan biosynthesis protein C
VGLGRRYLTRSTPFLTYANEAVLPFCILHQTVILGLGHFVVQRALPGLAKWAIIFVSSSGVIMALYELLVRRYNGLRLLFGLKWRQRAHAANPRLAPKSPR